MIIFWAAVSKFCPPSHSQSQIPVVNLENCEFITLSFLGRHNEHTNKEEIVGVKGEGIPTEDLRMMITDATKCPQLIGNLSNLLLICYYKLLSLIVN